MSARRRLPGRAAFVVCGAGLVVTALTLAGCDLNPRPEDPSADQGEGSSGSEGSGGAPAGPQESRTPPPLFAAVDDGLGGRPSSGAPDAGPPPPPSSPEAGAGSDAGADAGDAGAASSEAEAGRAVNRAGD